MEKAEQAHCQPFRVIFRIERPTQGVRAWAVKIIVV
jgi:hypothetical protein